MTVFQKLNLNGMHKYKMNGICFRRLKSFKE